MPQRDKYHAAVKQALIKDGWTITHDPYYISLGSRDAFADLGAERVIAAEQGQRKIAVEIKSFVGRSTVTDLEQAMGQYIVYRSWMRRTDRVREIWLAVSKRVALEVFDDLAGQVLIQDYAIQLLVVDMDEERIVAWRS